MLVERATERAPRPGSRLTMGRSPPQGAETFAAILACFLWRGLSHKGRGQGSACTKAGASALSGRADQAFALRRRRLRGAMASLGHTLELARRGLQPRR